MKLHHIIRNKEHPATFSSNYWMLDFTRDSFALYPYPAHTRCSLKVFSNLIATYNVGMVIKETLTMQNKIVQQFLN
jgi:hypothetical protein